MKITKTSKEVSGIKRAQQIANLGCDKCPCCGETRDHLECIHKGINGGIMSSWSKTWAEGLFKIRNMKCDCYKCYSCDAEWESSPYQWL